MNTKDIYDYSRKELAAKAVEIWEIHAPRYATNLETWRHTMYYWSENVS